LDPALAELVKVRASQINGCVYCLALHLQWARKAGVPGDKLDLVAVWPEARAFDSRERAALAWTEAVTRAGPAEAVDAAREALGAQFTETEILGLTLAVATINAWNRIAGPLRFPAR
jgi:AhpD family alkylhydroperoxidase